MKIKQSTVLSSAAGSPAIACNEAGLLPGMSVPVIIGSPNGAFSGTAQIQTSQDGTSWANASGSVAVTAGGVNIQNILLAEFVRLNVSAFSSGNLQATFLFDID